MATLAQLDALIDANLSAFRAIAGTYEVFEGGVPTIDGFIALINNAAATNFGSNRTDITFNQENAFINLVNAQVQGNTAAAAKFQAITAGAASLQDKLGAIYDTYVPAGSQTAEGRAFFTRPEAVTFYQNVAAERGVAGSDGAAIVALASLLNILVNQDIGIGDDINDLRAAIDDGSAALPENGATFTPIETADGTAYDDDDNVAPGGGNTFTLTTGNDFADQAGAFRNGTNPFDFQFTASNETVVASTATIGNAGTNIDTLLDPSTADEDQLNVTVTGNGTTDLGTVQNLENVNLNVAGVSGPGAFIDFDSVTGAQTVTLTGAPGGFVNLGNLATSGVTEVNASGMTSAVNGLGVDFTGKTAAVTVTGSAGGDNIIGGNGADTLSGGAGFDILSGGAVNDTIDGGANGDTIDGGTGNDTLLGGAGGDVIVTGVGNNTVTGGGGGDTIALGTVAINTVDAVQAAVGDATDGGDETASYANGQLTFTDTVTGPDAVNDSITRGLLNSDFTAGTPALTVTAAGTNTVIFEATASANGFDTILGFNAGAGGDKLDFSAFLGEAAAIGVVDGDNGVADNVSGLNIILLDSTLAAATDMVGWDANSNVVIIEDNGGFSTVYYGTTDANGDFADITSVGTLDVANPQTLTAVNFA